MTRWFLALILISGSAWAMDTETAVKETQKVLRTPQLREKTFNDPNANQAHNTARTLSGDNAAVEQEMWELAAELVPLLAEKGESDPAKMAEYLEKMRRNPAAFIEQFSEPQRARLRTLSEKIQKASQKQKP